jgi:hypothetical protein
MHIVFWWKGGDYLAYLGIDGRIWVGMCGLDASDSGKGPVTGHCEHGNEPSGSIKVGEFLD